jgi:hypothetical protein
MKVDQKEALNFIVAQIVPGRLFLMVPFINATYMIKTFE